MAAPVSDLFDPDVWTTAPIAEQFTDITYHKHVSKGIVRVAFDRPEVRNAFRPRTVDELYRALDDARQDPRVGVVLLTGSLFPTLPVWAPWLIWGGGLALAAGISAWIGARGLIHLQVIPHRTVRSLQESWSCLLNRPN